MRFAAASAFVLAALLVVSGGPAAADCIGPTVEVASREVVRGGELVIHGSGWGDNCYDTGNPPAGEGVLGRPLTGIGVYIVQGNDEWLIATGEADAEYKFEVTVVVPTDLQTGAAEVQARYEGDDAYSPDPRLLVEDAPALSATGATVATFGPRPLTATSIASATSPPASAPPATSTDVTPPSTGVAAGDESTDGAPSTSSSSLIAAAIGAALVALAAAGFVVRSRRG